MPLMREWTEITVDEDLLVPVVRELLDMAVSPNQVEVVHGTHGRVILVEIHLAEHWFQERLKRDREDAAIAEDDFKVLVESEVVAPAAIAPSGPIHTAAATSMVEVVEPSKLASAATPTAVVEVVEPSNVAVAATPMPIKRVPVARPLARPSASPKGEES